MERSGPSPHLCTGLKEKCGQLTASFPLAGTLCKLPVHVPRVLLAQQRTLCSSVGCSHSVTEWFRWKGPLKVTWSSPLPKQVAQDHVLFHGKAAASPEGSLCPLLHHSPASLRPALT